MFYLCLFPWCYVICLRMLMLFAISNHASSLFFLNAPSYNWWSQAVVADRTVYVSGCLGLDTKTMKLVPGGAVAEAEMALKNLEAVLVAADSGIDKVIKNTIFLKDLNDFGAINEVYKKGMYVGST